MTFDRNNLIKLLFTALIPTPLLAAQGALEINQACAANVGCFPGDSAGFPVTIDEPGSYQLTGNLDLTDLAPGTGGLEISGGTVSLDLNGFEIRGSTTCTGSGADLECNPSGIGRGISVGGLATGTTVRNGTVRNFGERGILGAADSMLVEGIVAIHNGGYGIQVGENSVVVDSIARENLLSGISIGGGTVLRGCATFGNANYGVLSDGPGTVVVNTTSTGNGQAGFNLDPPSHFGGNVSLGNSFRDFCGFGICSNLRRYYLTTTEYMAGASLDACDDGFHMALLAEIHDPTPLAYDTRLGAIGTDGGGVPTWVSGWIRTGGSSSELYNCSNWTSSEDAHAGTLGALLGESGTDWSQPGTNISPWVSEIASCDTPARVWCIEDLATQTELP